MKNELRFSSTEEALQHLANFTGKQVKVAVRDDENHPDPEAALLEFNIDVEWHGKPVPGTNRESPVDGVFVVQCPQWRFDGVGGKTMEEVSKTVKSLVDEIAKNNKQVLTGA